MDPIAIIIAVACAVVFGVGGFIIGGAHRKKVAESAIGSATEEAARIVNNAMTEAEQKKKEAILEAKDEIHKQRTETEKELPLRRSRMPIRSALKIGCSNFRFHPVRLISTVVLSVLAFVIHPLIMVIHCHCKHFFCFILTNYILI